MFGRMLLALGVCMLAPVANADDWFAREDGSLKTPAGAVLEPTELFPYPVQRALALAEPGDTVFVVGDLYGSGACPELLLGSRNQNFGRYAAGPIQDIEIVGQGANARIGSVYVSQKYGPIEGVLWRNLTIHATWNHAILFAQGYEHEDFAFVRVVFERGKGSKWGARVHGPSRNFLFERCRGTDFTEHGLYLDNSIDLVVRGCFFARNWRTGCQVFNRIDSGRSSSGFLMFEGNTVLDTGSSGAAGLAVYGHQGTVIFSGNKVSSPHDTYGLLVSREKAEAAKNKRGAHLDPDGYATQTVMLFDNEVSVPNTGRGVVAVSSTRELLMGEQKWGPSKRPDLWLSVQADGKDFGGGPVGRVVMYAGEGSPTEWEGWSGGTKVRRGTTDLSDREINLFARSRQAAN